MPNLPYPEEAKALLKASGEYKKAKKDKKDKKDKKVRATMI